MSFPSDLTRLRLLLDSVRFLLCASSLAMCFGTVDCMTVCSYAKSSGNSCGSFAHFGKATVQTLVLQALLGPAELSINIL